MRHRAIQYPHIELEMESLERPKVTVVEHGLQITVGIVCDPYGIESAAKHFLHAYNLAKETQRLVKAQEEYERKGRDENKENKF